MMRIALTLAALLLTDAAVAQERRVWTPAPVPGTGTTTVPPADRAGRSSGPDNASPFSGVPSGSGTSGGQDSPTTRDSPATTQSGTPSVSR